jgi:hypothetical protein
MTIKPCSSTAPVLLPYASKGTVYPMLQVSARTVFVAMTKEFCGITRARLTSPAWLICCTTCTLPAAAPKPPT